MLIILNTERRNIPDRATLEQLLDQLALSSRKGFAIAVNQQIVTRTSWSGYILKENDSITLIHATQGG